LKQKTLVTTEHFKMHTEQRSQRLTGTEMKQIL